MKTKEYISVLLKKFDLVLIIMNDSDAAKNLTEDFLMSEALQKTTKKIMVLSNQNIPYTNTYHQYCRLSADELDAIQNIYFMYDFSDHFQILSDGQQYGGLLNYVKTGILTMEDVFQTILGL